MKFRTTDFAERPSMDLFLFQNWISVKHHTHIWSYCWIMLTFMVLNKPCCARTILESQEIEQRVEQRYNHGQSQ